MNILVLNAGSSSLKFRLFDIDRAGEPFHEIPEARNLVSGQIDRIGSQTAALSFAVESQMPITAPISGTTPGESARQVIQTLQRAELLHSPPWPIHAVGHRIVHGGARFTEPIRIDKSIEEQLASLVELAPLHNPPGLAGIRASMELMPDCPTVAVFDTSFHHNLPEVAHTYAVPSELNEKYAVRRYGFHGISYRYVLQQFLHSLERKAVGTRLIVCHLGNGASLCAIKDGRSVDTSMGFTPMEGLVMGSRCGDVDAGLILYLMHREGYTPDQMEMILNKRSGLKGLTDKSDVRDLEKAAEAGDTKATFALELFAYHVRKYIGSYAAILGGLDAIAFTGGIGEHSASMRARMLENLVFLNLRLDSHLNHTVPSSGAVPIHSPGHSLPIWVIPTNEELQIARETFALLSP